MCNYPYNSCCCVTNLTYSSLLNVVCINGFMHSGKHERDDPKKFVTAARLYTLGHHWFNLKQISSIPAGDCAVMVTLPRGQLQRVVDCWLVNRSGTHKSGHFVLLPRTLIDTNYFDDTWSCGNELLVKVRDIISNNMDKESQAMGALLCIKQYADVADGI